MRVCHPDNSRGRIGFQLPFEVGRCRNVNARRIRRRGTRGDGRVGSELDGSIGIGSQRRNGHTRTTDRDVLRRGSAAGVGDVVATVRSNASGRVTHIDRGCVYGAARLRERYR